MPKLEIPYYHAQAEVEQLLQDAGFDLNKNLAITTPAGDSSVRIYEQADDTPPATAQEAELEETQEPETPAEEPVEETQT